MPLPAHTPWQLLVPECVHVTTRICTWLPTYPPPHLQPPPPPPNWRPNSADLADLFRRFVGFLNFADLFCRFFGFL